MPPITEKDAMSDALECLKRLPDVDGAYRQTCIRQLQIALAAHDANPALHPAIRLMQRTAMALREPVSSSVAGMILAATKALLKQAAEESARYSPDEIIQSLQETLA